MRDYHLLQESGIPTLNVRMFTARFHQGVLHKAR